jgi:hypothetical protein
MRVQPSPAPREQSMQRQLTQLNHAALIILKYAALFLQAMGISFEGNTIGFLNLLAQVDQGLRHEVPNPIPPSPKLKGSRELKNLECSINFDARSRGL